MNLYHNGKITLGVDWENGFVTSFVNDGIELTSGACLPMFALRLRMPSAETVEFDTAQAELIDLISDESGAQAKYALGNLTARISVQKTGADAFGWCIQIENATEGAVEWAEFPRIPLKKALGSEKARFYWPYNEGVQIDDIDLREATWWGHCEPEYPGMGKYALFPGMVESQFVACELKKGIYLGAHDPERGIKNIDIIGREDHARLKMRIYAGGEFEEDYCTAFDVVTAGFEGGWMAAAEIYRSWLEHNLPGGMKKISQNPDLPEWYGDSPVVVTYPVRGLHDTDDMKPNRLFPYENALPVLDELAEGMNSRLLTLLMHWEGTAPWAPPFVWPPYGGEEMLRAFADKLHDRGHRLGVYLSGIGWTQKSNLTDYNCEKLFEEGGYRKDMCLAPDGSLPYSEICTAQRRGYDMCPMGEDTAKIVAGEVRSMATAGIDYAQILDQNHGGNPYFCYSRDHGHAPTPGPWMTKSMQALLARAHETAPEMLFGCESAAGEPYIPNLLLSDNRFNLGWYYGKPIPIFAYLYHEYLNNFMGNQVCAADTFLPDPESYLYRLAYSCAAGDLPTIILTDDGRIMQAWGDRQFDILPDRENVMKLIASVTALRRGEGKKYLHLGRMIAPEKVETECRIFKLKAPALPLKADKILTSRWQAEDGTKAQVLINWTAEDVSCTVGTQPVRVPALSAILLKEE